MATVMMSSGGGTERVFESGLSMQDALDLCELYDWHWTNENGFDWALFIREDD